MWSLKEGKKELEPKKFSNNKTQEDIVKEVLEAVEQGNKIIFIHGVCGSGKSAIALNIAKELGGKRLGDIIAVGEVKALEDSAGTIVRSADSANQAFTEFNLALGALKPTRDVFEGLATIIGDELMPAANGLTDTFVISVKPGQRAIVANTFFD